MGPCLPITNASERTRIDSQLASHRAQLFAGREPLPSQQDYFLRQFGVSIRGAGFVRWLISGADAVTSATLGHHIARIGLEITKEKVRWIHAFRVIASMQDVYAERYRAIGDLKRDAMREPLAIHAIDLFLDHAIALIVAGARKFPATIRPIFVNLLKKARFYRDGIVSHLNSMGNQGQKCKEYQIG